MNWQSFLKFINSASKKLKKFKSVCIALYQKNTANAYEHIFTIISNENTMMNKQPKAKQI